MKRTLKDVARTLPTALIAAYFPCIDSRTFHLARLQGELLMTVHEEHQESCTSIDLFNDPIEEIPLIELGPRSLNALSDFQNALIPYIHACMDLLARMP